MKKSAESEQSSTSLENCKIDLCRQSGLIEILCPSISISGTMINSVFTENIHVFLWDIVKIKKMASFVPKASVSHLHMTGQLHSDFD